MKLPYVISNIRTAINNTLIAAATTKLQCPGTLIHSHSMPQGPGYSSVLALSQKAMAPHSSTLAWKIPWMEKSDGLQSLGSLRVGHD